MGVFTYENKDNKSSLETYEWDRTWIDQANDGETTRVLYIGDSISSAILRVATECAAGRYLFDGYASSKGLDNPYLMETLKFFAREEGRRSLVIFNNGLHGWHLDDEREYRELLKSTLAELVAYFDGTPVAVVLTTDVDDPARSKRVDARNGVAMKVAEELSLPVIDIHGESVRYAACRTDGVHFNGEGYKALAAQIVAGVDAILG